MKSHTACIKALLLAGADPCLDNDDSLTPLDGTKQAQNRTAVAIPGFIRPKCFTMPRASIAPVKAELSPFSSLSRRLGWTLGQHPTSLDSTGLSTYILLIGVGIMIWVLRVDLGI